MIKNMLATITLVMTVLSNSAGADGQADPAAQIASQREAMLSLQPMNGVWRGHAWTLLPSGNKHTLIQTERVGGFLNDSVKVIEGKGYEADGTASFNALGIISFNVATGAYSMRSYAMGKVGDFPLTPTADGFIWEIVNGPITLRYTAQIRNGTWHEVGDRIMAGRQPIRFFEMELTRLADTDWPAANAIPPQ